MVITSVYHNGVLRRVIASYLSIFAVMKQNYTKFIYKPNGLRLVSLRAISCWSSHFNLSSIVLISEK